MAGYVYGFVLGFAIAFSSALAGSIVCFYFCRRWFKSQVRTLMSKNKNLKSVVRTVEKRGFRLLVLIRLAPYPFNVMNALLSATHISLPTYALATAISLFKLTLHVYIGSTLSTLTNEPDENDGDDPSNPGKKDHGKALKIFVMVVSIFLGIGVGAYVWLVAKREVAITEAIRTERRRRRRIGLGVRPNRRSSENSAIELGQAPSSSIPDVDLTNRGSFDDFFGSSAGDRHATSDYVGGGYLDEDEDEHEGQSLFGRQFRSLDPLQQHSGDHAQNDAWRNVGANLDSSTDSEDDYTDDDDDELDQEEGYHQDLEQGVFGDRNLVDNEEEEEEGALDFSAHHAGLVDSPWRDDEAPGFNSGGALGGEEDDEDDDLVLHSSTKRGGNSWR
ncbi:hypothetical protein BGZ83_006227 [Gryganskiella cystojenkinii]|nr:hypothetical protein BGZ83_006227 [Gryganskiella cystojenkinii]